MNPIVFAARNFPPAAIGGIETLSEQARSTLAARAPIVEVANRRGRRAQWAWMALANRRVRSVARRNASPCIDVSDLLAHIAIGPQDPPQVVRVHGLDVLYPNRFYRGLLSRALRRPAHYVANSHATARLMAQAGADASRVHVVWPTSKEPTTRSAPRPGRLVIVGRQVPRKGTLRFLRNVWPMVCQDERIRLDIVGEGPDSPAIAKAVRDAPAADRIAVHGRLPPAALESVLGEADVLVANNQHIPGDWEGFGIAAIEAAMRGIVPLVNDVDGCADSVRDGQTGWIGSEDDLAHRIRDVVDRRRLSNRRVLADEARRAFGPPRFAREYWEVVDAVAS